MPAGADLDDPVLLELLELEELELVELDVV